MPTLRELAAAARPTVTIQFRGRPLAVRHVTIGQMDAVRRLVPPPAPPVDPVTAEPNHADPDYLAMAADRQAGLLTLRVAIGAGFTDRDGREWDAVPPEQRRAWIDEARRWVREELSDEEGMLLLAGIEEAGLAGGKRLSPPPTYAAVRVAPDGSREAIG